MDWRKRIVVDPKIQVGKPVIRGTRLTVELMLQMIAVGCTTREILDNYPGITEDDLRACVAYAAETVT